MKMSHADALSLLDISGSSTWEDIKLAYRRACRMYHPDRNPAGLEMMKLVNAGYESLRDYVAGSIDTNDKGDFQSQENLGDEMNAALNAIIGLGLTIELCGSWIWVSGDTRPHKAVLKAAGYRWAPKKMMWHWRPAGNPSWSRGKYTMDEIRERHGSVHVKTKQWARLSA